MYTNPDAKKCSVPDHPDRHLAKKYHETLPSFAPTPLVPLDNVAKELGVKAVFIKTENGRFGLPAFKILGASWATFRALVEKLGLPLETTGLDDLAAHAQTASIKLFAATDGNHGRAVARMGALLGLESEIFVPDVLDHYARDMIKSEKGASVTAVAGDYDATIQAAAKKAGERKNGVLIQDTSFEGYDVVPAYVGQGYATMLLEIETQLAERGIKPTVFVSPVGVGSLAEAVVTYCKSEGRSLRLLTVEPETAGCLHESLKAGKMVQVKTSNTIMSGLNCGTVSPISWPVLQAGVDASVTISDIESHHAVEDLKTKHGVDLGPCGVASLSGLRYVASSMPDAVGLSPDSVVVLLGTEGYRPYDVPGDSQST